MEQTYELNAAIISICKRIASRRAVAGNAREQTFGEQKMQLAQALETLVKIRNGHGA